MNIVLSILALTVGFATVCPAMAQDAAPVDAKTAQPTGDMPRGGWDGNNLRISVTRKAKLLSASKK